MLAIEPIVIVAAIFRVVRILMPLSFVWEPFVFRLPGDSRRRTQRKRKAWKFAVIEMLFFLEGGFSALFSKFAK